MFFDKLVKYSPVLLHPGRLLQDKSYVLILSHMRSRSTLLSHILGSHPEICGYKELHLSYTSILSLLKLRVALEGIENFNQCRYLLDKALHNKLVIDTNIFNGKLKIIMLLREPRGTVSSMFKMHQKLNQNDNYLHLVQYYKDRLSYLHDFAEQHDHEYLFIESDNLISDADQELQRISEYLALKAPLQAQYKQFSETGIAGSGDPSENIKAGEIIDTTKEDRILNISDAELIALNNQYSSCVTQLGKHQI